jgi:hypothetical protein
MGGELVLEQNKTQEKRDEEKGIRRGLIIFDIYVEVGRDSTRFNETGKESASSAGPAMYSSWTYGLSYSI